MMKKAILLAGFGVGDLAAKERCIDPITLDVKLAFPEYEVAEAWTSVFLRKKAAKHGVVMKSISEALQALADNGVEEVIVQPTHLTQGEEYLKKVVPEVESFKAEFKVLKLGRPALAADSYEEYKEKLELLFPLQELNEGEELVMMGHGSPNIHNTAYEWLQKASDEKELPVHIGVVEDNDFPNKSDVIERLTTKNVKKVYLCPLLLSGGDHANNDMAGDEPDSWKNAIRTAGIEVRCNTRGLGEKAEYRKLYIKSIEAVMKK